jgi:hypothetical protein
MATEQPNMMSATDFIQCVRNHLSLAVTADKIVFARYDAGFSPAPYRGCAIVNFYNMSLIRFNEKRGGGAEAENNRQMFIVWGFNETADSAVSKIKLEQSINGIGCNGTWAPNLRGKTASPEKVAQYLATYINKVAADFAPYYSHD